MKPIHSWLKELAAGVTKKKHHDIVDESSQESFPASDPPAWAGSKAKKQRPISAGQDAVNLLIKEHQMIMRMIYVMHEQIEQLQQNNPVDIDKLHSIIDFMHSFVDLNHHHKEENFLFPALEHSKAPLKDCSLTMFKQDHKLSQAAIESLKKATALYAKKNAGANEKLIEALSQLKDIYIRHTLKEENFIFPLAEKYLSKQEQKNLLTQFEKMNVIKTRPISR